MRVVNGSPAMGFGVAAQGRVGRAQTARATRLTALLNITRSAKTASRRVPDLCELRPAASRGRGVDTLRDATSPLSTLAVLTP